MRLRVSWSSEERFFFRLEHFFFISLFIFLKTFIYFFSVCFLVVALYAVVLHVNVMGRIFQYLAATEVCKQIQLSL